MTRFPKRDYAAQRFYGAGDPVRTIDQALADHVKSRAESKLPPSKAAVNLAVGEMVAAERRPAEQRVAAGKLASMMIKAMDDGWLQ